MPTSLPGWRCLGAVLLFAVLSAQILEAQTRDRRLGRNWGGEITYEPRGSGVLFDALDPTVKKWFIPQELFVDYRYRQWEYTNYARDPYQRYVNVFIEGEPFYDLYGNYLTRGWLIYDWNQNQPVQFGSSIYKDPRFNSWFNTITVNSDSHGQYSYSITVGDRIRTTLTPLTFSKPRFNGVQMDFAADKYLATMLFSRVSLPTIGSTPNRDPSETSNATNLMAGRGVAQIGDFVKVGATMVNAHNTRTFAEAFQRSPFAGTLGAAQTGAPVSGIALILGDDSPEDGEGGATLFAHDIVITAEDAVTRQRTTYRTRDVSTDPALWPAVTGGSPRGGALAADGGERIVINYDFNDLSYAGPRPTEIVDIRFDLVVSNDYRIQVWSDQQTGRNPTAPTLPMTGRDVDLLQPPLLDVAVADGNVKDNSNQRRILFDYGLPTARMVYGFDVEVTDVWGFDAYAELDLSRAYRMYPNPSRADADRSFATDASDARAWMINLSRQAYPYFLFGEAFDLDPDYSTQSYLVDALGEIKYDDQRSHIYEFVDDNDDYDRNPDWARFSQGAGDPLNFPGWDENNDFVSDFNQNDNVNKNNRLPDYDEPFFRYHADRPEFLFGIDLNNNNWIDRFENDDLPDLPYRTDQRGFNLYGGSFLGPEAKLTLGRLQVESISSQRRNRATYGLFTFDRTYPFARVRAFEMVKRVKDSIPDDRFEMTPHLETTSLTIVQDILPARDTWITSSYLQLDYQPSDRLNVVNKLKFELYSQQGDAYRIREQGPVLEESTRLFGIINKADYTLRLGDLTIHPKIKSQFLQQTAFTIREEGRKEWAGTGIVLLRQPMLRNSLIETGAEFVLFRELLRDEGELLEDGPTGATEDEQNLVLALQWSTTGSYLGYRLTTQFGLSYIRTWEEQIVLGDEGLERDTDVRAFTTSFITVYAGLQ